MIVQITCVRCGKDFEWTPGPKGGGKPKTCSKECSRRRELDMQKLWREQSVVPKGKHGTWVGYATYLCACDECRVGAAEYQAKRREKRERRRSEQRRSERADEQAGGA